MAAPTDRLCGAEPLRRRRCFFHMSNQSHKPKTSPAYKEGTPQTPNEAENIDDTLCVADDETAGPTPECRTTEEVRQGHTGDHVRYILAASITGIVIIFAIVYLYFVR